MSGSRAWDGVPRRVLDKPRGRASSAKQVRDFVPTGPRSGFSGRDERPNPALRVTEMQRARLLSAAVAVIDELGLCACDGGAYHCAGAGVAAHVL
jgi:hypothetical protein